jgi:hypothetical protein
MILGGNIGAPEEIRTPDPQIRRLGLDIDSAENLCKPSGNEPFVDQWVTISAANQEPVGVPDGSLASANLVPEGDRLPCGTFSASKERVREQSVSLARCLDTQNRNSQLAHPSNRLVAQLNERWRVVDDPLEWILQRRKGNPRSKNQGWMSRSYCTTQVALLRCVDWYCGNVEPAALAKLNDLPALHSMQNLDVHETDQVRADAHSDCLISQGLEESEADHQRPRVSQSALY